MNPKHKYDLTKLESAALAAYANWASDDSQEHRTVLFETVRDLAYAILQVGPFKKYNIDYEVIAYEYSLYLFQRFILGSFRLIAKDRFPLQLYISKNIRHVIFSHNSGAWQELITDMEFLVDSASVNVFQEEPVNSYKAIDKKFYAQSLMKVVELYYSKAEINRLLPIALDMIFSNSRYAVSPSLPTDLKDFSIILIAASKRFTNYDNIFFTTGVKKSDLKTALKSATRSTVFLSTVVNSTFFPKELLLSLDIDSLYRLVSVMGGNTIRIPTMRELDTVLGAVVSISRMLLEDKPIESSLNETKLDYDLVFSNHVNLQYFISKSMESFNLFKNDDSKASEPMINVIASSIQSLDVILQSLQERVSSESSDSLLNQYVGLSDTLAKFTDGLIKISSTVRDNIPTLEVLNVEEMESPREVHS